MAAGSISIPIEVTGEQSFQSALSAINAQMKAFQAGAEAAGASLDKMGHSEEAATSRQQSLNGLLEASQQKLELLRQKYQQAQEHLSKLADEMEKAKQAGDPEAIDRAANAYNRQSQVVAKLETDMAKTEQTITNTTAQMQGMGDESSKLSGILEKELVANAIKRLDDALNTIQQKMKEFVQGLIGFVSEASQFEGSMAKVATIADGTAVSYGDLSAAIIDLSEQTGIAATEIAEATYQAISGGVDTAQAVGTVATATQLATGGFTTSSAAIDVLTTAMNAYGMSAEESMQVADKLITTQNLGKTSVAELAQYIGRVIPIAASFNVNLDNLSAAYAVLTASGINTANSTTYLAGMLQELSKDGSTVAGVIKDKTGQSFSELMANGASLDAVLQILMQSVDGDTVAFNNLWSSQTAGLGALTLVNAGSEKYNATLEAMQESAGATSQAYEQMTGTFEHSQQQLSNSLANLKIALYEQLKEPIGEVMQVAQNAVARIQEWASTPRAQELIQKLADAVSHMAETLSTLLEPAIEMLITGINTAGEVMAFMAEHIDLLITAFVALKAAVLAVKFIEFINGIGSAITAIQSIGAAFSALLSGVSSAMSGVIAAVSALNPVVLAIAAAVAAAAALIIANWDSIKEWAVKAWEGIKSAWDAAGKFFSDVASAIEKAMSKVIEWLGEQFKKAWEAVQKAWNAAGQFFQSVWKAITQAFSNAVTWIGNTFKQAWTAVTNVWNAAGQFFQSVWKAITQAFANVTSWIGEQFQRAWAAVTNVWNACASFFSGVWDGITGALSDVASWIGDQFQQAWDRLASVWDKVSSFFADVFNKIVSAFSDLPGKMLDIGKNAVAGIWEGISNSFTWIKNKLTGWVGNVLDFVMHLFGINSPSTVMRDKVGIMLGEGVAEGILRSVGTVQKAYDELMPNPRMLAAASDSISSSMRAQGGAQQLQYALQDNRPIILRLDDRELGRAVRGYV